MNARVIGFERSDHMHSYQTDWMASQDSEHRYHLFENYLDGFHLSLGVKYYVFLSLDLFEHVDSWSSYSPHPGLIEQK